MVKGTLFARKTALDGVGAMKSFGGCGREVVEVEKKGGMLPILTALNGRPGGCQGVEIEGWVRQGNGWPSREEEKARKGQELALRTALNGRPRAWDREWRGMLWIILFCLYLYL